MRGRRWRSDRRTDRNWGCPGDTLEDKILDDAKLLTHCGRANLLVVADDEYGLAEIQRNQRHDVALAGFVDDDHVEASDARVEILDHPGKRHHPHGDGAAALRHFSGGLGSQERNTNPRPLCRCGVSCPAIQPALDAGVRTYVRGLRRPRAFGQ